jgi:ubiquinol-cytochrome c reductase cytochrome b subunit
MATGFIGYVLPWGQMSFWGATVITNLASAIPIVGETIVYWLWGGFAVDNPTLNRFLSLHYVLPFIVAAWSLEHIILLHNVGSSNPTGTETYKTYNESNKISFYPYFYLKDLFSLLVCAIFFYYFLFLHPNTLGHSDNYIEANPLITPTHIVPEWYFLPFYAIL